MSKNINNENFPVGKFIKKSLRPLVWTYYSAAREADDIADSAKFSVSEKNSKLDNCYKDFMAADSNSSSGKLGKIFASEQLDYRLYTDLLEAFRKDVNGFKVDIWEQLLDYCHYSAAPVGRFMLAIHNQSPATYIPAEILCTVLQITNHLQDLKSDACKLKRCYIPQELLQKYHVRITDFCLQQSSKNVKLLIDEIVLRLQAMLSDAGILIKLISDCRLRSEVAIIFSLTNSMLKKIKKWDVISHTLHLSSWDWLKAIIYGIWSGVFVRSESCNIIK